VSYLVQALVNGLLQGGLLALVAAGFTLVWGVLNVVNLAHGAMVVLGACLTWELVAGAGLNPVLAAVAVAVAMFGFGYALQRGLLNLVARAPALLQILVTFGVGLLLNYVVVAVFSTDDRALPSAYTQPVLAFGRVYVPTVRLVALLVAGTVIAVSTLALRRTRYGLAIRAVGMERDAARLMGIRVRHAYAVAFGVGAALAGVAGALVAVIGVFSPAGTTATTFTLQSFVIAVIGGIGSLPGAFAGGLLLGVFEALAAQYLPGSLVNAIALGALVLAMLVRPQGLAGQGRSAWLENW
jgi:branched-chain amino acid transport system permease protein